MASSARQPVVAVADADDKTSKMGTWAKDNIKPKSSNMLMMYIGPLAIMVVLPVLNLSLVYTILKLEGSGTKFLNKFRDEGVIGAIVSMHPSVSEMMHAMKYALGFMALQLVFMPLLPGKYYVGPVSPSGHRPTYKANGVAAFLATIVVWMVGSLLGLFKAGVLFEIAFPMCAGLNIFAIVFCLGLYLKGVYAPSTGDSGCTGNFVFDYWWGTELYPRFGHWMWSIGWDIKQFTNCRFGMLIWGIMLLSYAAHQYEQLGYVTDALLVSVFVQEVYILKFFSWEMGYVNTMDIQHDRAGYYICYGCLVFVPSFYTSHSLFLAANPVTLGPITASALAISGVLGVWVNWDCDNQKVKFRESGGKATIWGSPARMIRAKYITSKGEAKESLLLLSGWWGVSRHFHYVPEWMAAFSWTAPSLWTGTAAGFFYFPYLVWLLLDRAFRDELRCKSKYGASWADYCKEVPYRIIPYVL